MQNLLVQGLASWHHRKDVFLALDKTFHDDWLRTVVLEELLHLRGQFLGVVATQSLDAHCLGQLGEIGVRHPCVRVACRVEKICELDQGTDEAIKSHY